MASLALTILALVAAHGAAYAAAPLTPLQTRALSRAITCPERLPDDAARLRNTEHFFGLYGTFRPHSHAGERMAFRDRLLRAKKCRLQPDPLIQTFPES